MDAPTLPDERGPTMVRRLGGTLHGLSRWALAAGGAVAGVLLLGVLGAELTHGKVPHGVRVVGLDVGGRSPSAATAILRRDLAPRLSQPVRVRAGSDEFRIDPAAVGLTVDVPATVEAAGARTWNPLTRLAALLGRHRDVDPVVRVDERRLGPVVRAERGKVGHAASPGGIEFRDLRPVPAYPRDGRVLAAGRLAAALRTGWLRESPVTVPLSTERVRATRADVDRLLRELARPAVAAPVTVRVGARTVTVTPAAVAASLIIQGDAARGIVPRVDPAELKKALAPQLGGVEVAARNATFRIVGAAVQVVPSVDGRTVDLAKLATALLAVLPDPAPRELPATLAPTPAALTTAKAQALGIGEKISAFTTYYPCCPTRNRNIQLVADEVDGALVLPGATFSLNGYTGVRGPAQGYIKAPVILGGRLVQEVGGGISQFATTLFNAEFFSGLQDVFHKTHSYYISRYPAGREATVFYPSLDLKFRNDSPYGVLIDTSWTNTSITVSFWSTKRYEVESQSGPRTDYRDPQTQYLPATGCIATVGSRGFNITVTRVLKLNGKVIRSEPRRTHYLAEPKFVCGPPPSPTPSPTP